MNTKFEVRIDSNNVVLTADGIEVARTENSFGARGRLYKAATTLLGVPDDYYLILNTVGCHSASRGLYVAGGLDDLFRWERENNRGYKGAVLDTGEHNYHDDSDFYAVVWDGERVKRISDGTTRCYAPPCCTADATPEVRDAAEKWLAESYYPPVIRLKLEQDAKKVRVGSVVTVVAGRKLPKGGEWIVEGVFDSKFGRGEKSVRLAKRGSAGYSSRVPGVQLNSASEWVYTNLDNVAVANPVPVTDEEVAERSARAAKDRCWRAVGQIGLAFIA